MPVIFQLFNDWLNEWDISSNLNKKVPMFQEYLDNKIAKPIFLYKRIENILEKYSICIIQGNKDHGKTWLLILYYYYLLEKIVQKPDNNSSIIAKVRKVISWNKPVNILFRYKCVDNLFKGGEAWEEISGPFRDGKTFDKIYYYILDDCQLNIEETQHFFDLAQENFLQTPSLKNNLKIILSSRSNLSIYPIDDIPTESKIDIKKLIIKITKTSIKQDKYAYFSEIIEKFLDNHLPHIKYSTIKEEIPQLYEFCKNDLYLLTLCLHSWKSALKKNPNTKISDIRYKEVYNEFWSEDGDVRLFNEQRKKALLHLALLCQFDGIKILIHHPIIKEFSQTFSELKIEGLIQYSYHKDDYYYSLDPSFAFHIIKAIQFKDREISDSDGKLFEKSAYLFRNYIGSLPTPPNLSSIYFSIMTATRDETGDDPKIILLMLHDDPKIWIITKNFYTSLTVNQFNSARKYFNDALIYIQSKKNRTINPELISKYHQLPSDYLIKNEDKIIEEIKNNAPSLFLTRLKSLVVFTDIEEFLKNFSQKDFEKIIGKGTFSSIFRLYYYYRSKKYWIAQKDLLNALNSVNISNLLLQDKRALRRINGFIQEVEKLTSEYPDLPIKNEILNLHNQILEKIFMFLVKNTNLKILVQNSEEIWVSEEILLSEMDSFEPLKYNPTTIFSLNGILKWLSKNKQTELLNDIINQSLSLHWNRLIYHEKNLSTIIDFKIKTFNDILTNDLEKTEHKKEIITTISYQDYDTIFPHLLDYSKFFFTWHIYLYNPEILNYTQSLTEFFSLIDFHSQKFEEQKEYIIPLMGIGYLIHKFDRTLNPKEKKVCYKVFNDTLLELNKKFNKGDTLPTQIVLSIISGAFLFDESEFLSSAKKISKLENKIRQMPYIHMDQKRLLLRLFKEHLSKYNIP